MKRSLNKPAGKVHLVGAGPGAPDLLTLRAAEILRRADIVFHDALVHPEVLALAARAEKIAVGKRCGKLSTAQAFINKRLVDAARRCEVVVRLKGGDPMLFGRAQEEIAALQEAGIPFEVVPGVTSALAAAADTGISLTRRSISRSVTFVTARVGQGEATNGWARSAAAADTAIVYMGAGQAEAVAQALIAAGAARDLPVLVVENASLSDTRRVALTLEHLPSISRHGLAGPTLIMIGRVYDEALAAATRPAFMPACRTA